MTELTLILDEQTVEIDLPLVHAAIAYHRQYQLRYWDALVLAAAKRAACVELLTEDFNDGRVVGRRISVNSLPGIATGRRQPLASISPSRLRTHLMPTSKRRFMLGGWCSDAEHRSS